MIHIPLIETSSLDRMMEFTHYGQPAPAGTWKKENIISRSNLKINIFVSGDFSVFVDEKSHRPIYGDLCLLPPYKLHYGQMLRDTYMDYYQLDLGMLALEAIPGGTALLEQIARCGEAESFLRPGEGDIREVMQLCKQLQEAVQGKAWPLAFAKTVELLSLLSGIYQKGGRVSAFSLCPHTQQALKYLEANFSEPITISALTQITGVSASYLSRVFRQDTGVGIHEYLTQYRVTQATALLRSHSVSEVAYLCGFSDCSHFIAVFKKQLGCTPKAYKQLLHANGTADPEASP